MSGGKETPRQKMIGLMYLVLMAMLAMNVSKQIINAFVTLNDKIDRSNDIIKGSMDNTYGSFDAAIAGLTAQKAGKDEIEAVKKIQAQAYRVQNMSKTLNNLLVENCGMMIVESGDPLAAEHAPYYETDDEGYYHLMELSHLDKKDDYDTPTRLFIGDNHQSPKGQFLVDAIQNYRDSLCMLICNYKDEKTGKDWNFTPPETTITIEGDEAALATFNAALKEALSTVNPADTSVVSQIFTMLTIPEKVHNHDELYPWVAAQFDHAPLVAAAAMFTSIQSDVLQAESRAVSQIASRVSAPKFNFNKIEPLAFGSTGYINQGDSLDLSVMIAAYDSTEKMKIKYWIDDSTRSGEPKEFKGAAGEKLKFGGGVGGHRIDGSIAVKEKGTEKWKPWTFNYSVGAPNAAVAAADLAVLYRNWDNRIKVSASGYDPSTISVTCSGCKGSLSKSGEYYIAKAGSGKEATISVSAKTADGKSVSLAAEKFRIFPLPKPQPYFAGQTFDKPTMKKGMAASASQIKAKLGDSPLNVQYEVTGFKMIVVKNGKVAEVSAKSGNLTGEMKAAIKKMPKGTSLTFVGISAKKAGGGKSSPIGGLSFKLI